MKKLIFLIPVLVIFLFTFEGCNSQKEKEPIKPKLKLVKPIEYITKPDPSSYNRIELITSTPEGAKLYFVKYKTDSTDSFFYYYIILIGPNGSVAIKQ